MQPKLSFKAIAIALWGTVGTLILLLEAVVRLSMTVVSIFRAQTPGALEFAAGALWTILITYTEGYRAFQQRFSPRVVARSMYVAQHGRPLHILLAPLFAMALIHATPRRLIANWIILAGKRCDANLFDPGHARKSAANSLGSAGPGGFEERLLDRICRVQNEWYESSNR